MIREEKFYIHFFNDVNNEDFQIDEKVYNKIYSNAKSAVNIVFKEEYLHEETEISHTLTLYKIDFLCIINDVLSNNY